MMEPPGTNCPPKTLMPSRCALESRPFLELPKPFLCAMLAYTYDGDVADLHFGVILAMALVRLYCFLRLNLKTRIFLPRSLPAMVAFT